MRDRLDRPGYVLVAVRGFILGMGYKYPINEDPVSNFNQEGKLLQETTRSSILKNLRIRRRQYSPISQDLKLATTQRRHLMRRQRRRAPTTSDQALLTRVSRLAHLIGTLITSVALPRRAALGEAVVLVTVEVRAPKEQRHDDEWFEERSDTHRGLFRVVRSDPGGLGLVERWKGSELSGDIDASLGRVRRRRM